jgi:hypothetical protein
MQITILIHADKDVEAGKGMLTDHSEEAIPERDPEYRAADGTLHQEQTVDELPAATRLDLARRLQQLGMSPTRAAVVASL